MKKITMIFCCNVALLLLVGCANDTNEESEKDISENDSALESEDESNLDEEGDESKSTTGSGESATGDSNDTSSQETSNEDSNNTSEEDLLSEYSAAEIEYARVWLQLGPNQDLDELNVRHIPAGEQINPNDDTSATYPEDVIQLAGSRLVDGSVTYSGNGDGTINVYNVPLRWDSNDSADVDEDFMKEYTEGIIEDAELVYVDPNDDEEIIELIDIMKIH
ncbi:hypothetical protein ACFSTA_16160 [Ornithinibacillus salinisoli]|uniref:Lipoprotein n=1 Tax=Ornithinibacillus salinisoli TaxID=1848459 RepID=A0ABW4W075_9BACI